MHQAEPERDHPAACDVRGAALRLQHDVLERHVDDRHGDQRLDERREPQRVGRQTVGRRDQRERVRDRERRHDHDQRSDTAERNDQAERGTAGDRCRRGCEGSRASRSCSAAWCHRGSSRTSPGLPENSNARSGPLGGINRIEVVTRRPRRASWGSIEDASARSEWDSREAHRAAPDPNRPRWPPERWPADVGKRLFERAERSIGRQRGHHRDELGRRQSGAVLENLEVVRDPEAAASRSVRSALPKSRLPVARSGNSMSRIARSGARTTTRNVRPSGFTNV